jgi:hypothetical protein
MIRYCILHRLSTLFGFAAEDITIIIRSRFVSKPKHMDCKKKAIDRGKNRRKLTTAMISISGYRVCFLQCALWEEEVRCTANVVDGYSAIASAQRNVAASAFWWTSLCPMWGWRCCSRGLERRCILYTAAAPAVVMMKTFLSENHGQWLSLLTIQYTRGASAVDPNANPSRASKMDPKSNPS